MPTSPTFTAAPRAGQVRTAPYSEYEPGAAGWVVEQAGYYGPSYDPQLGWAIPAWEEHGYGDLGDVFPTRAAAEAAIRDAF